MCVCVFVFLSSFLIVWRVLFYWLPPIGDSHKRRHLFCKCCFLQSLPRDIFAYWPPTKWGPKTTYSRRLRNLMANLKANISGEEHHRGNWKTALKLRGVPYTRSHNFMNFIPCPPLENIWVMVIVWRLRGNIIRTAVCWIVWHNDHNPQHTYLSSSYRSNGFGLSHLDPYAVRRGGCLELYYCNMVEWFWWDSSLLFDDQLVSFSALTLLVWSSGL